MKTKWIVLFLCFVVTFRVAMAQDTGDHYVVLDWSFAFFNSELYDANQIRGSVSSYSEENSNKGLATISFRGTTGVKYESSVVNGKISLGIGLRYSQYIQNAGKWDLLTDGVNYFYFQYSRDDQSTEYARVHSIMQRSGYLGMPLEFSFYPFTNTRSSGLYLKFGTEVDFRLKTRTNINFKNEAMQSQESVVASQVSIPAPFGFTLYNCLGIRTGAKGKPSFGIEAFIPIYNINPGSAGLLRNKFGGGLQFHWHIPIQSKIQ